LSSAVTSIGREIAPRQFDDLPDLTVEPREYDASQDNIEEEQMNEISVAEQFKMNRNIATVRDAWNEYCHGGPSANNAILPSIKELDVRNPKWKGSKSTTEGKFYQRRLPLWRAIEALMSTGGYSEEQAIIALDGMCHNHCNNSLRKLCDELRKYLESWNNTGSFANVLGARSFID